MAKTAFLTPTGQIEIGNTDWTDADRALFDGFRQGGVELNYPVKNAIAQRYAAIPAGSGLVTTSKVLNVITPSSNYVINSTGDVAMTDISVVRNNLALTPGIDYTFNATTHTYTFSSTLTVGETLLFIYNKAA